ncbi:MAG: hypothetical protein Q7S22_01890 [Candidatus Micrarchaeota archaeon]|nr:hypothetical protein [Candidatus Micrarchaeota archaeon]
MRREVRLIFGLVVFILILVALIDFIKRNVEKADATKFVTEDLKNKYSGADVSIIATTEKSNTDANIYYEIKSKVTTNLDSACPERTHIYYNYPEQNFVAQPPEYITRNCKVCTEGTCVLAFPEEAIIASHTLKGTQEISTYLAVNKNAFSTVIEQADGWLVSWDSPSSDYSYSVNLARNGAVVSIEKNQK